MCTHDFQGRKSCDVFVLPKWLQPNVIEKNATNMKKITKGGRGKGKKKKENEEKMSLG